MMAIRFVAKVDREMKGKIPAWGIWDNRHKWWYNAKRFDDEIYAIGQCQLLAKEYKRYKVIPREDAPNDTG